MSDRHPYMFSCGLDKMVKCWDLEYNKARAPQPPRRLQTKRCEQSVAGMGCCEGQAAVLSHARVATRKRLQPRRWALRWVLRGCSRLPGGG